MTVSLFLSMLALLIFVLGFGGLSLRLWLDGDPTTALQGVGATLVLLMFCMNLWRKMKSKRRKERLGS